MSPGIIPGITPGSIPGIIPGGTVPGSGPTDAYTARPVGALHSTMGRPRSTCAVGLRAAATAGAAAADNTLLRIRWEGWQVVGWQIAVSRTTRERIERKSRAVEQPRARFDQLSVQRDGHQIICSTSLQRRTCSMSAQPAQLADHGAGYRPCGRQAVLAMASFAARAQRSRRRGRPPRKPPMRSARLRVTDLASMGWPAEVKGTKVLSEIVLTNSVER